MNPDNLNLLPQNLQVSKGLVATLKTLKSLGVILIFIFVVFSMGMLAFFIYSKITLDSVNSKNSTLASQIKAQEASEQQLILLKDRLGKIAKVKNLPNASGKVVGMNTFFENTSNVKLTEADINPTKLEMSLNLYSNEDLTTFIRNLKKTTLFNQVELSNFNFNSTGYTIDVSFGEQAAQVQPVAQPVEE